MRTIHTITSANTKAMMEQLRDLMVAYGGVVDSEAITGSSTDYFLMSFPTLNPGHQFKFYLSSGNYYIGCCRLGSTTTFVWSTGISTTRLINTIEIIVITGNDLLVFMSRSGSSYDYLHFIIAPFSEGMQVSLSGLTAKYLDDTVYSLSTFGYNYDAKTEDGKIYLTPVLLFVSGEAYYRDTYSLSYIFHGANISPGVRMGDFVEDELNYYFWLGSSLYCALAK